MLKIIIKNLLKLNQLPQRIEAYDNSHIFGKQSVGVMIVVDQEGFSSKNYRKFNIRYDEEFQNKSKIDDYYMMKEVLSRRLRKINKNSNSILPDVIILDGGKGHLIIANEIILENNLTSISLMSVSKGKKRNAGREIIHILDSDTILKPNDPLLFFIQRIRDEAHRFAITTHRHRRKINVVKSLFHEISGIGPKRKKYLMLHFGTIDKIKHASYDELNKVEGIKNDLAKKIYDFFNNQ